MDGYHLHRRPGSIVKSDYDYNSQKSNKTAEDLKVNKKENLKNNLKGLNILKNLKAQRQNKFGGS